MKKIFVLFVLIIMMCIMASCTYTSNNSLIVDYDSENRQCYITNISEDTDYEELVVTVVLQAKENFNKEIVYEIGNLEQGKTYNGDLSYISEDIEVSNMYIESYEYYKNDTLNIIAIIFASIWLVFLLVSLIIMT